ncbi:hypothetical protein Poli38472_013545 [Pythium oligandrum]|uniref:TFIIS N-terminal domain-containing protein n=1 Tax=Pythium oligandrum TaxID=41045 RepID=A0A8K1C7H7_PYTOL|nr:hypothetical protein Poli38472_013545 [Pythium oligandrum]|eukprot:TMW58071.1 hypothetical protein Poli38472_013545 [Pythium oligandrum]
MANSWTRDPFGFVGAHVIQRTRRRRRRGSISSENEHSDDEYVLHGWITRFDIQLDAYTLFTPGVLEDSNQHADEAQTSVVAVPSSRTQYSRGDVMKFNSNPDFQVRHAKDPAFPPPEEDYTTRFVNVPMQKRRIDESPRMSRARKRRGEEEETKTEKDRVVYGHVECFLPFADLYKVVYDDDTVEEVTESEVIDNLIASVRQLHPKAVRQEDYHDASTSPAVAPLQYRKRRRVDASNTNGKTVSRQIKTEDSDDETEDEDATRVKREMLSGHDAGKDTDEEADPIKPEPLRYDGKEGNRSSAPAMVDLSNDGDETMEEFVPLDEDVAHVDVDLDTSLTQSDPDPDAEIISFLDAYPDSLSVEFNVPSSESSSSAPVVDEPALSPPSSPTTTSSVPPVFYIVDKPEHIATDRLETRAQAFEILRQELLRLLEMDDLLPSQVPKGTVQSKTTILSDILHNRDIKDRDSVRRFVDSGGLVVVNHVMNAHLTDVTVPSQARNERVLFLLKILAMLPTPTGRQVMESTIGKTIGRLSKSRRTDKEADPTMPKCLPHLAKWIKTRWIQTMERDDMKPTKSQPSKASNRTSNSRNSKAPSTTGRPSKQPDPTPRPSAAPAAPRDVLGHALSSAGPPKAKGKASLKPDWMRQKESLSRTRFTVNTDARAEQNHYNRDRRQQPSSSAPSRSHKQQTMVPEPPAPIRENDIPGGTRGVFGRNQKLAFGSRWSVCEFYRDTPPTAVRRFTSGSNSSITGLPPPSRLMTPKRSILRRNTKYTADPDVLPG